MKLLVALFARFFAQMPLAWNHRFGAALGWLTWCLSPRFRHTLSANIRQYARDRGHDVEAESVLRTAAVGESGKGVTELAIVWTAPVEKLYGLIKACEGWEHVETARATGRGILFVTPHLGCYDIAGRFLESRIPVLALYRPPKQKWLEPIMQAGRERGEGKTAAAGSGGVRSLLKTLKSGGNVILLPDQVPAAEQGGEGVWAPFFGKPAYTMTLLPRLAESTGAAVLFFFAERLPGGAGFHVRIEPPVTFPEDKMAAAKATNAAVERLIEQAPAQYLWAYNRYKHPAGAPLPPAEP